MTVKIKKQFPKKELNAWLRLNKQWDHHDWLDLLDNLTNQGFHNWSLSVAGQKEIGFYLETRRR
ncbi:MAG: hypothetical protein MAG581_02641 [Deltaproteobacteria bacterium]|jgi:hypothetical protein|nr:hypothetical protein [Deltaproteobacteria bacterium]